MVEGFRRCADHLEKFGGHEHAGGLSIKKQTSGPLLKPSKVSPANSYSPGISCPA